MSFLAVGVLLLLAAGIAAVAPPDRQRPTYRAYGLLFAAGCMVAAVPAIAVLSGAAPPELRFDTAVPGGAWVFGIDALSAAFLLAILGIGAACALYGTVYLSPERDRRAVAVSHLLVAVLVSALVAVVTARAAVPFLIAWETMALSAYLLVVFEHEKPDIRRAGLLYLVAAHTGTLALFALFAAWGGGAGDLTFASLADQAPLLPAGGATVFVLALFGFGLKAGMVPFHFWLPEAHGAAPSHVSALMSGVVIKAGIYGLLRVITLHGSPPAWWCWLLLLLGAASGVMGVVWALAQHDIKRLLAFHSVENIGIILIGMGAGALGIAYGRPALAVLGFAGAALHTLNHALFKSLLFLGAGALSHATGTRDIDRLGALAKRMPRTAVVFLIGSAAIVGLPPLNGFVSEWLVVRSLLAAGLEPGGARLAVLAVALLGLIGALALACFAKVVGIIYLGVARDPAVEPAHEAPAGMLTPMLALAGACVLIGLLPVLALPPFLRVGALVAGAPAAGFIHDPAAGPVTIFTVALAAGLAGCWLLRARLAARHRAIIGETWACGYDAVTPRMQYTASSFATPLLIAYGPVAGVHMERTPAALSTHAVDPAIDTLLLPLWRGIRSLAARLRPLQRGRLSLYLAYIGVAVVGLLVYLIVQGRAS